MNEIKLHIHSADTDTILALPYANEGIRAGFPYLTGLYDRIYRPEQGTDS